MMQNQPSQTRIDWQCTSSSGYAQRTKINAQSAAITIYVFDTDFEHTSGRTLTQKHAKCLVPMRYQDGAKGAWESLQKVLDDWLKSSANGTDAVCQINVAGNSISRFGSTYQMQPKVNGFVYLVLEKAQHYLQQHGKTLAVRSGGQSGADWAGLVAAHALEVQAVGLFPAGFRQRMDDGTDVLGSIEQLERTVVEQCAQLLHTVQTYRAQKGIKIG